MSGYVESCYVTGKPAQRFFNGMAARTLLQLALRGMEISALPSIGDIPLYDADVQQEEGFPCRVEG